MDGPSERIGLCATCRHARRISNRRGSVFLLCARAAMDPKYTRYPRLPVTACDGYEPPKRQGRQEGTSE